MKLAVQIFCLILSFISFAFFVPTDAGNKNKQPMSMAESLTGVKPQARVKIEYAIASIAFIALVIVIQVVWR